MNLLQIRYDWFRDCITRLLFSNRPLLTPAIRYAYPPLPCPRRRVPYILASGAAMERDVLRVKRLRAGARLPERATEGSSGFDLYACVDGQDGIVLSRQPQRVGTGIAIEFPRGFDVQVRPRSGLAAKGIGVMFGTIDSDYRGEVLVTMYVFGDLEEYRIGNGDRIAQLVVTRLGDLDVVEAEALTETARGDGGHGSTGQ